MASKERWYERLFGKRMLRCSTISDSDGDGQLVNTNEVLANCEITIIYFSFANINAQSDDVSKQLMGLYHRLNNEETCSNETRKLEVVQVVLWANNDVFGDFQQSHKECIEHMPWYALPFSDIQLKTRLSRRYRIKIGVPMLVLVDSDGVTVTSSGKERLLEDPHGEAFPWKPRSVDQVLHDVTLIPGRLFNEHHPQAEQNITRYQQLPADSIRGFYFSAHWCPPCRAFTPQLIETYKLVRKKEPGFEVIFVSSDRSVDSFHAYTATMPWIAVPWQQAAVRAELAQVYGVRGIPTLLLVDGNGHVITHDARTELQDDPRAQNFPWKPRPVNILTERFATKLHDYPAIVLFIEGDDTDLQFADNVLSPAADTYYKKYNINFNASEEEFLYACDDQHYIQFLIGLDNDTSELLRDLVGLDDVVPLLVGLDIPNNRYVVMDYGMEISVETVADFVNKFQTADLEFKNIHQHLPDAND